MSQQERAEQLLSWSVNGFAGAREVLEGQVEQWLGEITMTPNLQAIQLMSMNSPNLRVRAAGIEVYLAAHSHGKSDEEAQRLIEEIHEIAWWEVEGRYAAPDPHDDGPERQRR